MPDTAFAGAPVLLDAVRTPFLRSGTGYADQTTYDLARMAVKGLVARSGIDGAEIDRVIVGTVVSNPDTPNVAREAALAADVPNTVPAHTVSQACISSNQALTSGMELIAGGQCELVLAGGAESLSDVPIRFSKPVRKRLFEARKAKSPAQYLQLLKGLKPSDLAPDAPAIAEFSTGKSMGESAEELAAHFGVGRQAQDAYAMRSHQLAARAWNEGRYHADVIPAAVPPRFEPIERDNGIRGDTTMEKLASLKPAFSRPWGNITAGNASYLTDGASAAFVASAAAAERLGKTPRAVLGPYAYVAQDPGLELLLGPAYAIPRVLDAAGLTLQDIDVFELHEAFAGQVLAVLEALQSERFAKENLKRDAPVGEIPMDKLNLWGGSLSIGHPFGATGIRLVATAADRLVAEDGEIALVAACAAGGLGHAMLLRRAS